MKKFFASVVFLALISSAALAQEKPALRAARAAAAPKVDGVLDDDCWKTAETFSGFTQGYPDPGKPPAFGTEVKVAFDEKNIYIGINCLDNEPSKIDKRMMRRDRTEMTDKVQVQLDPYITKREAYAFLVSASSSLADFFVYNEFSSNMEWNGVWEGRAVLTQTGWSCELAIPFSEMRIFHSSELPMGFQVTRRIARTGEVDYLSYIPPGERKNVSGFGTVEGISDIKAAKKADLFPFLVLKDRLHTREGFYKRGASFNAGIDFRYPLSSRFTLTGTVNPDFGQVEQDSTVLNLSAYETFFSENRPFFMEGFQNFKPPNAAWSDTTFLYTRRIGAPPYQPYSYDGHKVISAPESTTILGALKVTGTTENRLNIAAFAAVTEAERATYADGDGFLRKELLKGQTLFTAFRLNQNFGTNSSLGFMQTFKDVKDGRSALLNAFTLDLHSKENKHNFVMNVASTNVRDGGETIYGTSVEAMYTEKFSKLWTFSACYIAHPMDFNPNDMGYLRRPDEYKLSTILERVNEEPTKRFNSTSLGFYNWYGKNGDGLILTRGGEVDLWGELLNRWSVWTGFYVECPYFDDMEPRLRGAAVYRKLEHGEWAGFATDSSKKVYFNMQVSAGRNQHGWRLGQTSIANFRFSDKAILSEEFYLSKSDGNFLFAGVSEDENHPLFADVSTRTASLTTRFSYTLTPDLTFDLYSQVFSASGTYNGYRKLLTPTLSEPAKASYDPGFHFGSNNITAVMRWEFRPASHLYVVYSHGQSGAIDFEDHEKRRGMSIQRELNLWTSAPRDDLFLIKFSYHF